MGAIKFSATIILLAANSALAIGFYTPPCENEQKLIHKAIDDEMDCLKKSLRIKHNTPVNEKICTKEIEIFTIQRSKFIECIKKASPWS